MQRAKKRNHINPETHPDGWDGYPFISVVVTADGTKHAMIVDNQDGAYVRGYLLDLCDQELVPENLLIRAAIDWWPNKDVQPFSAFLSLNGLSDLFAIVYRLIPFESVIRVVGPCPCFPLNIKPKIRRRKKRQICEAAMK